MIKIIENIKGKWEYHIEGKNVYYKEGDYDSMTGVLERLKYFSEKLTKERVKIDSWYEDYTSRYSVWAGEKILLVDVDYKGESSAKQAAREICKILRNYEDQIVEIYETKMRKSSMKNLVELERKKCLEKRKKIARQEK